LNHNRFEFRRICFLGVLRETPTLTEETPLISASSLLPFRKIDVIPVVKSGRLEVVGVLSGLSVIRQLNWLPITGISSLIQYRAGDTCRKYYPQITKSDSLVQILNAILETRFGYVINVENQRLQAVVSLRDIIQYASDLSETDITVSELASPPYHITLRSDS